MSLAKIYGLPPVFMVNVLGASMASVGFTEGIVEAMMSLARGGMPRDIDRFAP